MTRDILAQSCQKNDDSREYGSYHLHERDENPETIKTTLIIIF